MATLKPDALLLHRLRNAECHRLKPIRRKLSDAVLARNAASEHFNPIDSDRLKSNIERGLRQLIPAFHIPNHPPYALMIQGAIKKLNEEGGVSEGDISEFIKRDYEDLPVAHEGFVRHHLRKLCESGVVVRLKGGRYIAVKNDDDGDVEDSECQSERREGQGRVQGRWGGSEDGDREEEAQGEVFGECIVEMQLKEKGVVVEKQEHLGVTGNQCGSETNQMQVSEGQFEMANMELDEGGLSEEETVAFTIPKQWQNEPQAQNIEVGTKILDVSLEGERYNVVVKDGGDGGVEDRECRSERGQGPGRVQGRRGRIEDGGREEGEQHEGFGKSIVVGRLNEEKQEHSGVTENQCESETKLMQMIEGQFDFERAGIELDVKIRETGDVVQGQNFEVGTKILECHGDENPKTQLNGPFAPDGQQQKPPLQGQAKGRRGKSRKRRKDTESSWQWVPFVLESHHEEQPPKRRGRPPKAKNSVDVSTRALVPFGTEHHHNEQPPRGRGRGRGRGRPPKPKPLSPSDKQPQKPQGGGRGRPPKPKQGGGEPFQPCQPHHPQQQPQHRGGGRPPRPKLVAENVENPQTPQIEQLQ